MRIEIEIPKEFEGDYNANKFKDFFGRVIADATYNDGVCGLYELETAGMLLKAFEDSKEAYNVESAVAELEKVSFERYGNDGMGGQKVVSLDDVISIVRGKE